MPRMTPDQTFKPAPNAGRRKERPAAPAEPVAVPLVKDDEQPRHRGKRRV